MKMSLKWQKNICKNGKILGQENNVSQKRLKTLEFTMAPGKKVQLKSDKQSSHVVAKLLLAGDGSYDTFRHR